MSTVSISTPPATEASAPAVAVDRKTLIHALDRAKQVVPRRYPKPVLTCVRLEVADGLFTVQATDGELSALTQMQADGELAACVVPCADLLTRLKAGKSKTCTLSLTGDGERLLVNGGRVEHALNTNDVAEFPDVPTQLAGGSIEVNAAEFCHAIKVTGAAVAREPSRYAIDGVLLESDEQGTRLAATDGRRLIIVELREAGELDATSILPQRFCHLIQKFTTKVTDFLVLALQQEQTDDSKTLPRRLFAAGPDWLVSTFEHDGNFPIYRDVVPQSHSKFVIDRQACIETLSEVALAANEERRAVWLDLSSNDVTFSAEAPGIGKARATLPAEFLGGGDAEIHTAFNPGFMLDALKTLGSEEVVINVDQNGYGSDNKVFGKAALLYARHDATIRWVLMPINAGLEATRAHLGSNYPEHKENE